MLLYQRWRRPVVGTSVLGYTGSTFVGGLGITGARMGGVGSALGGDFSYWASS